MRVHLYIALALSLAACGDDSNGGAAGSGSQSAAAKKADSDKKKAEAAKDKAKKDKERKMEAVSFIPTLEKVVPPAEAATIRRKLKESDFDPDPTGTEHRDPWRSYTLPQVVEAPTTPTTSMVKPSDACPKNKLIASNYAIRDLALLGIVTRGLQHYALFRDSAGVGHVVERGKCIGREKGLVTEIGDGFVGGEIRPEVLANGSQPAVVKFTIPLYVTELNVDTPEGDESDSNNTGDGTSGVAPPTMTPVAPPAPSTPPPPPTTTMAPSPPPTAPAGSGSTN